MHTEPDDDPTRSPTAAVFLQRRREVCLRVRRIGVRVGADPDDFLQDVVERFLPRFDRMVSDDHATGYLITIAVNLANDVARRPRHQIPARADDLDTVAAPGTDPLAMVIRAELHRGLRDVGHVLSGDEDRVLLARARGLSRDEIAALTGLPSWRVKRLLEQARRRAKHHLRPFLPVLALPLHGLRRVKAALPASPAVIVLATWTLTVAQLAAPQLTADRQDARMVPAAVPIRRTVPRPAAPRVAVRPTAAVSPTSLRRRADLPGQQPAPPSAPPAKVCVGDACVGEIKYGYALCANSPEPDWPLCVTQDVADPCPLVPDGQPFVTCRETS